jgi:adenylate kinase family enzyme
MSKTMVAFSGAIASGKSTITKGVSEKLGWARVGFGDYIRDFAKKQGKDPSDRSLLQRLGQLLVQSNVSSFVSNVLNQSADWENADGIIVDGLRHAEVRLVLQQLAKEAGFSFKHVHIELDDDARQGRASNRQDPIEPAMLAKYDSDLTEAQLSRILPAYADLKLDGYLPTELLVEQVVDSFDLQKAAAD